MRHGSKPYEFTRPWKIIAVGFFCVITFFVFCLAIPFQPYNHLAFTSMPDTVCIHEGVQVEAERDIEDPLLGSLSRAEVKSTWFEVNTGETEPAGIAPIPIEDTGGLVTLVSPILREAPPKSGTYKLYSETTVYGHVGLVPRDTTIATTSDTTIEVEDCTGE